MAEPEVEDENEIVPVSPNLITPDDSDNEVPVASCHSLRGTDTRDLQHVARTARAKQTAVDAVKALARAKAEKAARDGKPRPPSVSAGKKQSKPSAITRPKQTKTKTPASSQVFDLFFPRSLCLDHVACCLSELSGQAIVAEDYQDLHWTALDGLQCASTSGNGPPSQQNQWKIRYKFGKFCTIFGKFMSYFQREVRCRQIHK